MSIFPSRVGIIVISGALCLMDLFLPSCSGRSNADKTSVITGKDSTLSEVPPKATVRIDTLQDDIASILAGLMPRKYFRNITTKKPWQNYGEDVKQKWEMAENLNLRPILDWRNKYLSGPEIDSSLIFYPFGGPDLLYVHQLFPNSPNYIVVGLEPPGHCARFDTIHDAFLNEYLEEIKASIYQSFVTGYFITHKIQNELRQKLLDGTLPIFYFYLKRTGQEIVSFDMITLDGRGKVIVTGPKERHTGYRIVFKGKDNNRIQTAYYFQFNLSNGNLAKHPEFLQFVRSFGKQTGFVKAASYIMSNENFTTICHYLLDNSDQILQDDSGIPYKLFVPESWNVRLFGVYTQTQALFRHKFQPDLKRAFEEQKEKYPVNFKIGYHRWVNETSLIFARKIRKN
jgi:hypothetical protein